MENEDINTILALNTTQVTYEILLHNLRHPIVNILVATLTVVISVVGFVGNSMVLYLFSRSEHLNSQPGNIFVVFLATTDILSCAFVLPFSAVAVVKDYWPFGDFWCNFQSLILGTTYANSCFAITLISVDRALAVVRYSEYPTWVTTKSAFLVCLITFLYSTALGSMLALFDGSTYHYEYYTCSVDYKRGGTVLCVILFVIMAAAIIPSFVIGFCNYLLIREAKKVNVVQVIVQQNVEQRSASLTPEMKKTIQSMMAVVLCFLACNIPQSVLVMIDVVFGLEVPPIFPSFGISFLYLSCVANPFIYAIFRKDFRKALASARRKMAQNFEYFLYRLQN